MRNIAFKLIVYSPDKIRLGDARSISSLQWLERYSGVGEAKLVCAATKVNIDLLQNGNLLWNSDRPKLLAQIQSVEIDDDMKAARITARAKMTSCRLEERVLMHTAKIGVAETGMLDMVRNNLRSLPINVSAAKGLTERYDGQISWYSVLDAEKKIAAATGLGFRVVVDSNLQEVFDVYKGADRTNLNSDLYVGYLGDTTGNVVSVKLLDDVSTNRNVAVVAGEGEGSERAVVTVDLSGTAAKRELYVNASDLSHKYAVENSDGSTTEKIMTEAEYTGALEARGRQALADAFVGSTVSAELSQTMMLFGQDYELGDILPLQLSKYGVRVNVRVTEITIVYERTKNIKAKLEVVP